jgi:hypothetical protein
MATVPTVNRMLLGQEIRYLIEGVAKISQAAAGELIRVGQSRIGNVINGEGTLRYAELKLLVDGISELPQVDRDHAAAIQDPDYIEWLAGLVKRGAKKGSWQTGHFRAIHEDFRRWVGVEQRADLLRLVGSEVVPDVLQTEDYVRALFATRTEDFDATLDEFVQARLARQEVLDGNTECQVVMSESCLHSEPLGRPGKSGADIMRQQIDRLTELSKRPNVLIQIMPFKARASGVGGTRATCFPFQLARVQSRGLAGPLEIAYFRSPGALHYVDDRSALTEYERTWTRLSAAALGPDQTRKYLKTITNLLYQ